DCLVCLILIPPMCKVQLSNLDDGPENHSRRTQFMQRLVQFADEFQLTLPLAYYPHWNGDLLDSRQTVLRLASTMTYNGFSPIIRFVEKTYQTGIRLSQPDLAALEKRLQRLIRLAKWFVRMVPLRC
ncbi:MAG: hypothetical protein ABI947_24675, partial [Chloroflexota bacterium]